jgi:hypothetical protein
MTAQELSESGVTDGGARLRRHRGLARLLSDFEQALEASI